MNCAGLGISLIGEDGRGKLSELVLESLDFRSLVASKCVLNVRKPGFHYSLVTRVNSSETRSNPLHQPIEPIE